MADNAMHLPPALDPVAVPTLLPCPFCNGTAEFGNPDEHAGNYVFCETCGAASHWADSTEEAGMVWNRRTGDPVALLAEVEQLRAQLQYTHAACRQGVQLLKRLIDWDAVDYGEMQQVLRALDVASGSVVLRGGGGEK